MPSKLTQVLFDHVVMGLCLAETGLRVYQTWRMPPDKSLHTFLRVLICPSQVASRFEKLPASSNTAGTNRGIPELCLLQIDHAI